jgi:hypothetical protein
MCSALATTKPAHAPHEKNGEQPGHSFSFEEVLLGVVLSADAFAAQSSAQHGLTVNSSTISVNITHNNFTQQM